MVAVAIFPMNEIRPIPDTILQGDISSISPRISHLQPAQDALVWTELTQWAQKYSLFTLKLPLGLVSYSQRRIEWESRISILSETMTPT